MGLHRLLGQPSSRAIRLFGIAARDQLEHLPLARRQPVDRLVVAAGRERLDEPRGHDRVEHRLPACAARTAAFELLRLSVLEQIARRAGPQRRQQLVLVEEARQHDHAGSRQSARAARASRRRRRAAASRGPSARRPAAAARPRRSPRRRRPPRRPPRTRPEGRGTRAALHGRRRGRRRSGSGSPQARAISRRTHVPTPGVDSDLERPAGALRPFLHRGQAQPARADARSRTRSRRRRPRPRAPAGRRRHGA